MKTEQIFLENGDKTALSPRFKCYDAEGRFCDRFTVVYLDLPKVNFSNYPARSLSLFGEQVNLMTEAKLGKHLGKRISFDKLPLECRFQVKQDLSESVDWQFVQPKSQTK